MDEYQWLSLDDPALMLVCVQSCQLTGVASYRPGDRKLRLFACACWSRRPAVRQRTPSGLEALRLAEALADGLPQPPYRSPLLLDIDYAPLSPRAADAALGVCSLTADMRTPEAAILRDILGNPFRPVGLPCTDEVCPKCHGMGDRHRGRGRRKTCPYCAGTRRCVPWRTPDVLGMAREAYERRDETYAIDPVRLAVLSDALEDVGCSDEHLLGHLRGLRPCLGCYRRRSDNCVCGGSGFRPADEPPVAGPHHRGCWALDLLLGRA